MNVRLNVYKYTYRNMAMNPEYDWLKAGDWVVVGNYLPLHRFDTWEEAIDYAVALRTFIDVYFKKPNREEK